MLVLLFVALWFIRGDLFYVLPCVILFLCFTVVLTLRLPRLGKGELVLALFGRLFDLRLFGLVCFLFLLVSDCGQEISVSTPPGWPHSFAEIDHEIYSTVILSLSLISGNRICTVLVYRIED